MFKTCHQSILVCIWRVPITKKAFKKKMSGSGISAEDVCLKINGLSFSLTVNYIVLNNKENTEKTKCSRAFLAIRDKFRQRN